MRVSEHSLLCVSYLRRRGPRTLRLIAVRPWPTCFGTGSTPPHCRVERFDPIWGTPVPIWGALPDAGLPIRGDDDLVNRDANEGATSDTYAKRTGRIDPVRPTSRGRGSEVGRTVRYARSTSSTAIRCSVDLHKRCHHKAHDGPAHSHGDGQVGVRGRRVAGATTRASAVAAQDQAV